MISSASLQIPSQDSPAGPRPVSAAVQPTPPPPSSSSRRQQRASHTVVSPGQSAHHGGSSRDDVPPYTDVYSHPAAVAYAAAHPRRTIPKFGPYLLLQTLGEGEFGKVKLGLHSQWGEEVAVKLIRRGNVDNSVRMSKVEREIEVLRTLKHPNIVRLYDVIETDKYIGIILEYASGGELFDHILAHRYLRERDAAKLFSQLISGVWYIHQKKIVHRDLKLENLLLDRHRNVIITDFGFANRFEHRADDLMQTSCGSPCYAAPELVISEGLYVGSAVDIWSCGVILYAMLAGYLPFDDDPANPDGDNINLLYKYIVNTPLSFPEYISSEARDLLGMMLVPDPARRSSLDAVMRHPWLAAYTAPRDGSPPPVPGVPSAFGRSVDQLERAALDQHQQRRLAYQRQMRAAAQAAHQHQHQHPQQQAVGAALVGRSQSHHIVAGGSGGGHRQAATETPGTTTSGRSQSTQGDYLYDSADRSVSASPAASRRQQQQPQGPVLGGDDDPFGPPASAHSSGKTPMLAPDAAAAAVSPKGHKVNGGGSGSGGGSGGFRHTIQVEYDEPRSHGRSGSHGQRRSEDREGHGHVHEQQQQQQEQQAHHHHHQQEQRQNGGPPVASPVHKERRPSQGSIIVSPAKPLPSTPPSASASGAGQASANGTAPVSFRALPSPAASASTPGSPKAQAQAQAQTPGSPNTPTRTPTKASHHVRTPSTPLPAPTTPNVNINVATASPPDTPIRFSPPDQVNGVDGIEVEDREHERGSAGTGTGTQKESRKAGRVSLDKLGGLGKMFGGGGGGAASSAAGGESSPPRVPSESGRSGSGRSGSRSSVLLSPSGKEGKEGKEKEKEGKKSRRNTLTVMVEPFRSTIRNRSAKSRTPSTGEPVASTNGREREKDKDRGDKSAKMLQPPHSALVRSGGEKSSAGPAQTFVGATGEIGVEGGGGVGMQASTSKARKVMAWFRGRSRVRDGSGASADEEEQEQEPKTTGHRSTTPTQAEYATRREGAGEDREKRLPVQVVITTPTSSTSRAPSSQQHPQRTPSTATADTSFTATTSGTPSLVTRFRNSVTIGGHKDRDRERDRDPRLNASASAPAVPQHPWGALRTHHGAVDQSTITTKPPPEVIQHVRAVLEGMGVEIQVESEYRFRCVRAKRRKGSMVMGGGSTPPLGALGNVGSAGGAGGSLAAVTMIGSAASNGVDKRGLPVPSPSSFSAPGGMLRGLLMRRQSSQVSSTGLASSLDDDIPSPLTTEPGTITGATTYGDPAQDAGDEVKFSVELTRIDRLTDTFSLDIRRMKGNLRSYKFLYDTLRSRADLQR